MVVSVKTGGLALGPGAFAAASRAFLDVPEAGVRGPSPGGRDLPLDAAGRHAGDGEEGGRSRGTDPEAGTARRAGRAKNLRGGEDRDQFRTPAGCARDPGPVLRSAPAAPGGHGGAAEEPEFLGAESPARRPGRNHADCATSNPRSLSPTEGGSPSSDEHQGHSGEAEDTQQDRAEAALLTAMAVPAETKTANQGQFSPSPGSSEQEILPFSKEDVVLMDSQTAALQQPASSGGNIGNFTTIVVQDGVLPGEAPYVCPDCGRSFLYEEQCALHQQSHRQASLGPRSNPVRCPQPVAKLYTCLDCGRGFPHQASLSKHRLWHTGDRPHTCAECKKTFRLKINLHLHERTHAVAKKTGCYICGQCGRTFNHHSNFLRHQMIHTGERPYTCGECGKTFIRKEHLATHRRLHTGERPYRCPLCPKSFTRKQHLVGHQRLHEGEAIWLADHPTQRHGHGHRGGIGGQADAVEPGLGQETYPP